MNPEQRACCLPFIALVAFDEPFCSSLVLTIAHELVIRGRIWWRLPFPQAFPQFIPCGLVRNWIINKDELMKNVSY